MEKQKRENFREKDMVIGYGQGHSHQPSFILMLALLAASMHYRLRLIESVH